MNLFFLSPSAVGNLINEIKTMYAMRSKRFSCLIHFSLCYGFFYFILFKKQKIIYSNETLSGWWMHTKSAPRACNSSWRRLLMAKVALQQCQWNYRPGGKLPSVYSKNHPHKNAIIRMMMTALGAFDVWYLLQLVLESLYSRTFWGD